MTSSIASSVADLEFPNLVHVFQKSAQNGDLGPQNAGEDLRMAVIMLDHARVAVYLVDTDVKIAHKRPVARGNWIREIKDTFWY